MPRHRHGERAAVAALVVQHLRDGAQVVIDLTGGWGGAAFDHLAALGIRAEPVVFSAGSPERTRDGLFTFLNKRAEMFWGLREALDPQYGDGIALPPDQRLAAQLGADLAAARQHIAIESKEEIHKRIGGSTDDADAVILAWHKRDEALRRQTGRRLDPGRGLR